MPQWCVQGNRGAEESRAGQFLRSRLVYIRGAGQQAKLSGHNRPTLTGRVTVRGSLIRASTMTGGR